jgi:hypothetical protein
MKHITINPLLIGRDLIKIYFVGEIVKGKGALQFLRLG